MTKRERIMATLKGEAVDRPAVALWRHFPEQDQAAAGLARAVVDWHKKWDWDFIKVTSASGYYFEDWGGTFEYRPEGNIHGTRTVLSRPVQSREALSDLRPLDVRQGVYGRELQALREIRHLLDEDVLVMPTIFSPFTIAHSLTGDFFNTAITEYPDEFQQAMEVITEVTTAFSLAALEAGADSIFYATQMAQPSLVIRDDLDLWEIPYSQRVLEAVRDKTDFILLHIHGDEIYFDPLLEALPVDAVNWHTRIAAPTMQEALRRFEVAVVGGLTEDVLIYGSPKEVRAQVAFAIEQTGGRRLVVGAGCVTPITTPEENIRAVREAIGG